MTCRPIAYALLVASLTAACRDAAAPAPAASALAAGDGARTLAGSYRWVVTKVEVIDLGTLPGGTHSAAFDINDAGVIVGESGTLFGSTVPVRWTAPGVVSSLGSLGGTGGSARGINANGWITGNARIATGNYHAFAWSPMGGMVDLRAYDPEEPETNSYGRAITDYGLVVGNVDLAAKYWLAPQPFAVSIFTPFSPAVAYDANSSGQIVGSKVSWERAFIRRNGVVELLPTLPDGPYMDAAYGISDSGVVVGRSHNRAIRWTDAQGAQDLGTLPGGSASSAEDVNDAGAIAGWSDADVEEYATRRAFVWRPLMPSKVPLAPLGAAAARRSEAYALNASNWVVGSSQTATGQTHATLWKVSMAYQSTTIADAPVGSIPYLP